MNKKYSCSFTKTIITIIFVILLSLLFDKHFSYKLGKNIKDIYRSLYHKISYVDRYGYDEKKALLKIIKILDIASNSLLDISDFLGNKKALIFKDSQKYFNVEKYDDKINDYIYGKNQDLDKALETINGISNIYKKHYHLRDYYSCTNQVDKYTKLAILLYGVDNETFRADSFFYFLHLNNNSSNMQIKEIVMDYLDIKDKQKGTKYYLFKAYLYFNGYFVKKDYKKSFELLLKVKQTKLLSNKIYKNRIHNIFYARSIYALSMSYYYGYGVKKDRKKAFDILYNLYSQLLNKDTKYYKTFDPETIPQIEYRLALLYLQKNNKQKAINLLKEAQNDGHYLAKLELDKLDIKYIKHSYDDRYFWKNIVKKLDSDNLKVFAPVFLARNGLIYECKYSRFYDVFKD